jgi:Bacteriophage CI repressor helix-turn-helix domain
MEEDNQTKQIVKRLKEILNVRSDIELSAILDVPPTTISTWKSRDAIPFEICLKISDEKDIDLNWLFKGKGTMRKNQTKEESPVYQTKSIGALESLVERVETLEQQVSELKKQA